MYRSRTFSDDLNLDHSINTNNRRLQILSIVGFVVIEFLISSTFYSYGVLFSVFVEKKFYTTEDGLWVVILYVSTSGLIDPWSRHLIEFLDENGYNIFRYTMFAATFMLSIGFFLCSLLTHPLPHILVYGIFGGVSTSFISTRVWMKISDNLDMDTKLLEGIRHTARTLSMFSMPHLIVILIDFYGVFETHLIFAAVLLNIVLASLAIFTLKINGDINLQDVTRYQSFPILTSQGTEMMEFKSPVENDLFTLEDFENNHECPTWPQVEDFDVVTALNNDLVPNSSKYACSLNSISMQTYYNKAGVNIMPKIPEENENDEEVDEDINKINQKRLNRISLKLKELNQSAERKDKFIENTLSVDSLLIDSRNQINDDTIEKEHGDKSLFKEMKRSKKRLCCTPYRKYKWRKRNRLIRNIVVDTFLKPLYNAMRNIRFYPSLISKASTTIISSIFITLVPYTALTKSEEENLNFSLSEAVLLLSYIAFSRCLFFLLALPLKNHFSSNKIQLSFICGLLLSASSMMLLFFRFTNDVLTISCLLFGFGYGMVTYLETMVYRNFIGVQNWNKIQGTLDTLTAIFVIIMYFIIYSLKLDHFILLYAACIAYIFNAALWIIAPLFKFVITTVKNRLLHSGHDSFLY